MRRSIGARSQAAPAVGGYDDFFHAEYPGVLRLCHGLLGDRARAEEAAQEAFLRVYLNWTRVSGYERPDAWVRRVAFRLALRAQSRDRQRIALERASLRQQPPATTAGDTDVLDLVAQLPRNQRIAVLLRYVEDLPTAEIAVVIGCAEATARVHLHRGQRRLAQLLNLKEGSPHE